MRCAIRTRSLIAPTAVPNVGDDPQKFQDRSAWCGSDLGWDHTFVSQASWVGNLRLVELPVHGLGMLMADKIKPSIRQAAAIALVAIGALAAAPWLVKITLGQINRPESEWGSRARLRSIRGDSVYTSDTDIY